MQDDRLSEDQPVDQGSESSLGTSTYGPTLKGVLPDFSLLGKPTDNARSRRLTFFRCVTSATSLCNVAPSLSEFDMPDIARNKTVAKNRNSLTQERAFL